MPATSASSSGAAPHTVVASRILSLLVADPCSEHFRVLPDPVLYVTYYLVISRPFSLADIGMTIAGPGKYSLTHIQKDVRRIVNNAKRYFAPEGEIHAAATALEVRVVGCVVWDARTVCRCRSVPAPAHRQIPSPPPPPTAEAVEKDCERVGAGG